jgi:alpha-tubulin suppressor-like RCC1 family protein
MVSLASIEVVRIACGGHTCVLGAQGELFTFGNGKHGQLGHGERRAEASPRRVQALRHARVLGIACGDFHTLALADDGHVYTWGAGAFGELGHGDLAHVSEPCRLKAFRRHELVFAACGASHNIVLLDDEGALGPSDGSDDEDERYGTRSGYEEDRHSSA